MYCGTCKVSRLPQSRSCEWVCAYMTYHNLVMFNTFVVIFINVCPDPELIGVSVILILTPVV